MIGTFRYTLVLLITSTLSVFAQQDAQFTQYMFNGSFFNPALAGREVGYNFSAIHRTQWLNYNTATGNGGAPVTQLITAQGRAKSKRVGYGFILVNDKIGAVNNLELNFQGSYHKKINRVNVSLGGYFGIYSSSLNFEELVVVNQEPNLPQFGSENQMALDFGAGILLEKDNFYFGLSSKHINQPSFNFGDAAFENRLRNHTYLLFGYRLRPIGPLRIEPSFLVKNVGLYNFSYDASVMATYQNKINVGLAYRGEESVSMILGYSILKDNSLKLGYAFDLVGGGLEAKSPTSHEIMLRYALTNRSRSREDIQRIIQRTPRFRF